VRGSRELPPAVKLLGLSGRLSSSGRFGSAVGPVGPAGRLQRGRPRGFPHRLSRSRGSAGGVYLVLGSRELPATLELREDSGPRATHRGIVPFGGTRFRCARRATSTATAPAISPSASVYRQPTRHTGRVHVVFGLPKEATFVRGDANFDGVVNISDAIFHLVLPLPRWSSAPL